MVTKAQCMRVVLSISRVSAVGIDFKAGKRYEGAPVLTYDL